MSIWKRAAPFVVLLALAVYFAWRNAGELQDAFRLMRSASPLPLAGAFAFQILYYAFAAVTVGQCLRLVDFPQGFLSTLRATFLLIFVSRIVPGPAATGPAAMYYILGRRGLERTRAAFVGPMFYAVDYTVYFVVLIAGVIGAALRHQDVRGAAVSIPILTVAVLFALLAVRYWRNPLALEAALTRLQRKLERHVKPRWRMPASAPRKIAGTVVDMRQHLRDHPGTGWKLLGAGTAMLLCDIVSMSLCFIAFGSWLAASSFVLGFCLATLGAIVSFLPGGLGTFELAMVLGFERLGTTRSTALAATLTYRVIATWLPLALGITSAGEFSQAREPRMQGDGHTEV